MCGRGRAHLAVDAALLLLHPRVVGLHNQQAGQHTHLRAVAAGQRARRQVASEAKTRRAEGCQVYFIRCRLLLQRQLLLLPKLQLACALRRRPKHYTLQG